MFRWCRGAKVIERLAHDLRTAFPDMKGFSRVNLMYMRAFAEAWPDAEIDQGRADYRFVWINASNYLGCFIKSKLHHASRAVIARQRGAIVSRQATCPRSGITSAPAFNLPK